MRKSFMKKSAAMLAACVISLGALAPVKAEASIFGDVLGSVIGGVAAMSEINNQVTKLDNEGRDDFYNQMREKYGVNENYDANAQLERIMTRLSAVIVKYDPTIKEKPYNYFVNNDTSFNAFCTLGHNISVNRGLFDTLNFQEDEIAFVIGHELAHGTHKDPANGVKKQVGVQVLASIVASSMGGNVLTNLGVGVMANLGTAKGVTLPMEKRADADAFTYCSEAGYNVGAGAAVWQRIIELTEKNDKSTSSINQLFNPSDHPKHVNRRDTYIKTMNTYSNKMVNVDSKTGMISVNKVAIGVPAEAFGQSHLERTYFVAGDIADVYHRNGGTRVRAYASNGHVYLGNKPILTVTNGDDANKWVANLNKANGLK